MILQKWAENAPKPEVKHAQLTGTRARFVFRGQGDRRVTLVPW